MLFISWVVIVISIFLFLRVDATYNEQVFLSNRKKRTTNQRKNILVMLSQSIISLKSFQISICGLSFRILLVTLLQNGSMMDAALLVQQLLVPSRISRTFLVFDAVPMMEVFVKRLEIVQQIIWISMMQPTNVLSLEKDFARKMSC